MPLGHKHGRLAGPATDQSQQHKEGEDAEDDHNHGRREVADGTVRLALPRQLGDDVSNGSKDTCTSLVEGGWEGGREGGREGARVGECMNKSSQEAKKLL